MTKYQFRLLSEKEQVYLIYKDGVYIGKRSEDGLSIVLFQVEGFYVEVYYTQYRVHISHICCYNTIDALAPYLEDIEIHDLVKTLH